MRDTRKYGEKELSNFYDNCPLFKKYCNYNLWSGDFNDYAKIKYCEDYIYNYVCIYCHKYILRYFGPAFLLILLTSPSFIKFLRSGFIKYLDFHFLLFLKNSSFFYTGSSFKEVELFVERYFHIYISRRFKEDLLKSVIDSIKDSVPIAFKEVLITRLKSLFNHVGKAL